jgi:hypothetical protein
LVGKSERKRPLRTPRRGGDDIIRIDIREIRWEVVNWMHLVWDRDQGWAVLKRVVNLRVL